MFNLQRAGNGWAFQTETELEEFVWLNLTKLFGFLPLKRQGFVSGQFCDILALAENNQLVVIELKSV